MAMYTAFSLGNMFAGWPCEPRCVICLWADCAYREETACGPPRAARCSMANEANNSP